MKSDIKLWRDNSPAIFQRALDTEWTIPSHECNDVPDPSYTTRDVFALLDIPVKIDGGINWTHFEVDAKYYDTIVKIFGANGVDLVRNSKQIACNQSIGDFGDKVVDLIQSGDQISFRMHN
jgi:hypothetical protein